MKQFTYDLAQYKGLSIKRVTIKVTDGHDEKQAIDHARARNLKTAFFDELVRLAIVDYDGQKPVYPFSDFDRWTKKTRDIVKRLFTQVNGLSRLKGLDTALEPVADGDAQRFDFGALPGVDLKSVTIREVTGIDEEKAVRDSLDGKHEFGELLIAYSIAKLDDQVRELDYEGCNSRTRSLIATAFNIVNSALDVPDEIQPIE